MNLNSLFSRQEKLDNYIVKEKGLEGIDLLPRKTVALICELYECINEARFFKFWSEDTKPRTEFICDLCDGSEEISRETSFGTPEGGFDVFEVDVNCPVCEDIDVDINPLLEEYVDTIHFTLSIANDLGVHEHKYIETEPQDLNKLVLGITNLATIIPTSREQYHVKSLLNNIILLGYQLGFTEQDIITAYHDKNKENYARQKSGY